MLTPDEIRAREFLVSLRGYDRDEVHDFLEQIARQVRDLQAQVETLQAGQFAPVPAEPALAPPLAAADTSAFFEDLGKTTQRILEAAHEAGSEIQRRARNEADRELAEACSYARKLIAEGQRRREVIETVVRMLEERRAELADDLRGIAQAVDQVLADLAPRAQLLTPGEVVEVAQIVAPDTTWVPSEDECDAATAILIDQDSLAQTDVAVEEADELEFDERVAKTIDRKIYAR